MTPLHQHERTTDDDMQRIQTTGALTTTPQAWTTIAKRAGLWDGQPDTRVQAKRAVKRALSGRDLVRTTTQVRPNGDAVCVPRCVLTGP